MNWPLRRLAGGKTYDEPASDFAPELIDAHKRIRQAKADVRHLLVRLSADRQDEYVDLALDVLRALNGRAD